MPTDEQLQVIRAQLAALGRDILEALRPVAEALRKFDEEYRKLPTDRRGRRIKPD